MKKYLKQPFPLRIETTRFFRIAISISLFVYFLFLVFQRSFGLNSIESKYKGYVILGYSLVIFIILSLNQLIIPKTLKNIFSEEKWTLLNQIIWHFWNILTISAGIYFYTFWVLDLLSYSHSNLGGFFLFLLVGFCISVIPITIITLLDLNYQLKKNLRIAEEINRKIQSPHSKESNESIQTQEVVMMSENEKEKFKVQLGNMIYISSDGNYVDIYFKKEKIEKAFLRSSLQRIEGQLVDFPSLFKCHRAYIVNIKKIKKVIGNSQGYKLYFDNIKKEIPVARSYSKKFREFLNKK